MKTYRVEVNYTDRFHGSERVEVQADTSWDALDISERQVEKDMPQGAIREIDDSKIVGARP